MILIHMRGVFGCKYRWDKHTWVWLYYRNWGMRIPSSLSLLGVIFRTWQKLEQAFNPLFGLNDSPRSWNHSDPKTGMTCISRTQQSIGRGINPQIQSSQNLTWSNASKGVLRGASHETRGLPGICTLHWGSSESICRSRFCYRVGLSESRSFPLLRFLSVSSSGFLINVIYQGKRISICGTIQIYMTVRRGIKPWYGYGLE